MKPHKAPCCQVGVTVLRQGPCDRSDKGTVKLPLPTHITTIKIYLYRCSPPHSYQHYSYGLVTLVRLHAPRIIAGAVWPGSNAEERSADTSGCQSGSNGVRVKLLNASLARFIVGQTLPSVEISTINTSCADSPSPVHQLVGRHSEVSTTHAALRRSFLNAGPPQR